MSMLRNVLTYMGLGPDEDYDDGYPYDSDVDDDEAEADEPTRAPSRGSSTIDLTGGPATVPERRSRSTPDPGPDRRSPGSSRGGARRPVTTRSPFADDSEPTAERASSRRGRHDLDRPASRPLRAVPPADVEDDGAGITIRSVPSPPPGPRRVTPRALEPGSFSDAKDLGDLFKAGTPVVMDLRAVDRDLARRLLDFASGLCYALDGKMDKLAPQVFLLVPPSTEVSDEDRRRFTPPSEGGRG